MPFLCKQRVETRLGDEVGHNGTRLPAPSLDVRGPLVCADLPPAGTVAGPDKAEVVTRTPQARPRSLASPREPGQHYVRDAT